MKKDKEKQTPIFSKLQDILGENSSRLRADQHLERAEAPPAGQSESREQPLPGLGTVPARDDASPRPEDQEFNREMQQEATTVAEVPARGDPAAAGDGSGGQFPGYGLCPGPGRKICHGQSGL